MTYTQSMLYIASIAMKVEGQAGLEVLALAKGRLPALDPQQLGSMAEEAEKALLRQGESKNTLLSYRSALRYWAAWFAARYHRPITLPVPTAAVIQYIVDYV